MACSTLPTKESLTPRLLVIKQLSTDALTALCQALEAGEFLATPTNPSGETTTAYLLDCLQHPKASKLIQYTATGPGLDLQVFKVTELKILARHLDVPFKNADKKSVIATLWHHGVIPQPM